MSNVVRAIRTRTLLDNLPTGDERWSALTGLQLTHPRFGTGTIMNVTAKRFRDAIFAVQWTSGKTTDVSTATFINGMIPRLIVPEGTTIPPELSRWVQNEESDQYRTQRLAAEKAEMTPRRRTASSKTSAS